MQASPPITKPCCLWLPCNQCLRTVTYEGEDGAVGGVCEDPCTCRLHPPITKPCCPAISVSERLAYEGEDSAVDGIHETPPHAGFATHTKSCCLRLPSNAVNGCRTSYIGMNTMVVQRLFRGERGAGSSFKEKFDSSICVLDWCRHHAHVWS